jgi:hypothetical protein
LECLVRTYDFPIIAQYAPLITWLRPFITKNH